MKMDWDMDIKGQNWEYLLIALIKESPWEEFYCAVAYITQDKADRPTPKIGLNHYFG